MNFNISNHPNLTAVTRTATLVIMEVDIPNKKIVLRLKINHFLNGIHIPELVKDIISIANNSHTITHPVIGEIGEFDYWMLVYESNTPLSTMLAEGIANIDNLGVINAKCNYQIVQEGE